MPRSALIEDFVARAGGSAAAGAVAWAAELREEAAAGRWFISLNRYLFVATRRWVGQAVFAVVDAADVGRQHRLGLLVGLGYFALICVKTRRRGGRRRGPPPRYRALLATRRA
jgi:hypothetical protein